MHKDGTSRDVNQPLDTHQFVVTIFPDNFARTKIQRLMTLLELQYLIRTTTAPSKDALPLLKLAEFGDVASGKGCLRTNANMGDISGIEVEHDAGDISFKAAQKILRDANLRCLIYTTPSHIPIARERWRVLLPLSQPTDKAKRSGLVAKVNGLFGGRLARESFALSQAFYFGSITGQREITLSVE